jgi:hypothetical protein
VPGVRPALVAADDVRFLGQQVDDLALPLVAPLRTDYDGGWHGREVCPKRRSAAAEPVLAWRRRPDGRPGRDARRTRTGTTTREEATMPQLVQIAGALLILAAFALAQRGSLDQRSLAYLVPNLVGSAVLAVDAYLASEWGFVLLEGAWAIVSASALPRAVKRRA